MADDAPHSALFDISGTSLCLGLSQPCNRFNFATKLKASLTVVLTAILFAGTAAAGPFDRGEREEIGRRIETVKARAGVFEGQNCHGTTLFLLGINSIARYVTSDEMIKALESHCVPAKEPEFGDIFVRIVGGTAEHSVTKVGDAAVFGKASFRAKADFVYGKSKDWEMAARDGSGHSRVLAYSCRKRVNAVEDAEMLKLEAAGVMLLDSILRGGFRKETQTWLSETFGIRTFQSQGDAISEFLATSSADWNRKCHPKPEVFSTYVCLRIQSIREHLTTILGNLYGQTSEVFRRPVL